MSSTTGSVQIIDQDFRTGPEMESQEFLNIEIKTEAEETTCYYNECFMCGSNMTEPHQNSNGKCNDCAQLMDTFFNDAEGKKKPVAKKPTFSKRTIQNTKTIKKPFKCDKCKVSFTLRTTLETHKLRLHSDLRPFKCPQCPKTFKINGDLTTHSITHSERSHFCQLCDKAFKRKSSIRSHMAHIHPTGNPLHSCSMCSKKFKTNNCLNYHLRRRHLNETNFKCKKCPKEFVTSSELNRHFLRHSDKKPFQCELCPKKFKTKQDSQKHVKRFHEKVRSVKCTECMRDFADLSDLKKHMAIHKGIEFKCKICSRKYRIEKDLEYHIKRFHDEKFMESYPCDFCEKSFLCLTDKKKHLFVHASERPFKCKQCNKSFKREDILKYHIKTVHEKINRYSCKICAKGFFIKSHLQHHLISAHTTAKTHICSICFIPLRSAGILSQHMKGHRGQMDFKCYFCPKTFYTMTPLENHLRNHTMEKLMCPLCNQTFTTPRNQRMHLKLHDGTKKMHDCYFCEKSSPNAGHRNIHMRIHLFEQPEKCLACGERFYNLEFLKRHNKKGCFTG